MISYSTKMIAFLIVMGVLSPLGCGRSGPELAEVTGVVTLDGVPTGKLSVQFSPAFEKGTPAYGVTDAEGRYFLQFSVDRTGALPGRYKVGVEPLEPEYDEAGNLVGAPPVKLPARYQGGESLTAEVVKGTNAINFDLTSGK
jgi:hypothetical protein